MKHRLAFALLATLSVPVWAEPATPLNQRAPLKAITHDRAAASLQEMNALFNSPMAEKISRHDSATIDADMARSRALQAQAQQAFQDNDYASTVRFSNNAINSFFNTLQQTDQPAANSKLKAEYDKKIKSAHTFIGAFKQAIQDSAHQTDPAIHQRIQTMISDAEQLAQQQEYAQANKLLDNTLITTKLNIRMAMQGATLTADKDTSPKGIYEYERFRSDTYRELITLLRSDRFDQEVTSQPKFLTHEEQGNDYHQQALQLGEAEHYDQATATMKQAVSEFKRAVKMVGFMIPD